MKKVILASSSPRRVELLENIGILFDIILPDYDEKLPNDIFSYEAIEKIAVNKGKSVSEKINYPALIISADTVVVFENKILGKPKDYNDAISMLLKLNGNTHIVVTSVAVYDTEKKVTKIASDTTEVTFNKLDKSEWEHYINEYKPYDKAGSYGIQEFPDNYVKNISGNYDNIMGLPTKTLIKLLTEINK